MVSASPFSTPPPSRSERKVLLAVRDGHIDSRLLASARSLCDRLGAGLEIFVRAGGPRLPPEMAAFIAELTAGGLSHSLSVKPVLRRRDVVDFANGHECIAAVVIDSLEGWESVAVDRGSNPWSRLSCPLVTAAPGPPHPLPSSRLPP